MFSSNVYPPLDLATVQHEWRVNSRAARALLIKYVSQCDSTSGQLYRSTQHCDTLLVAEQQTHGKGQFERAWVSQTGDLIFSIGLRLPAAQLTALSLRIGVALHRVFAAHGMACQLKWPNDIIARHPATGQRGKLAGILVQSQNLTDAHAWVVIGVGVNIGARLLPQHNSAFAPMGAAQLSEAWVQPAAGLREQLLIQLVDAIVLCIEHPSPTWLNEWNAQDLWRNAAVTLTDPQQVAHNGTGAGINLDGAYVLRHNGVDTAFHSGQLRAQS
ncbi:MAG: biotin--[acetyl-CoA-carboxylase] ligase [Formosimonas sp.]